MVLKRWWDIADSAPGCCYCSIPANQILYFLLFYHVYLFIYFFRKSLKDTVGFYSVKALEWNILQVGVLQDGCSRFLPDCFLLQGSLDGSMLHSRSSLSSQFEDMILFRHASVACLSQIEPFTTNDGTFANICFIFTGNRFCLWLWWGKVAQWSLQLLDGR